MKIKMFKNGAYTIFERVSPSGYYLVKLYSPTDRLAEKILCDTLTGAREYLRAFNKIAKSL